MHNKSTRTANKKADVLNTGTADIDKINNLSINANLGANRRTDANN